jgi:tetratricopeptide (TPR) repeat protein
MHQYGVRDVEKLLGLPRSTIRTLVASGFVTPRPGPRNAWQFSFQDLILLRTAQALVAAKVSPRRIAQSVRSLRKHLPGEMPMSGLSIGAIGNEVVVKEGRKRWQADSGQYLLSFEGDPGEGSFKVIPQARPAEPSNDDWFGQATELEEQGHSGAAAKAYREAIAADSTRVDARINLGRLLHDAGDHKSAERIYRDAIAAGADDPVLFFNLGVLLEDMGRPRDAVTAYEAALRGDAALADCHYNLALLFESLHRPQEAIRHMARYRRLVGSQSR